MSLRIDILTVLPEMFNGPLSAGIVGRAREFGLVDIDIRDIREHAHDRHRITDDTPYGGGGGMVMKPEPVVEAIEGALDRGKGKGAEDQRVIYLTPQGCPYNQAMAQRFAKADQLILVCGRYEGIDERVLEEVVGEEVSIGDYVLTGGEIPAMVVVDSVVRLIPGAVGNPESIQNESFWQGLLDFPHYTRPEVFRERGVPEVLLSGHHAEIEKWRRRKALERTLARRPDLLEKAPLTADDRRVLDELRREDASRRVDG